MKDIFRVVIAVGILSQLSSAATCVSGTLATYIGLGSNGCSIGNDTLAGFQLDSGTTGATEIAPASVLLSPSGSSANPSLTASVTVTSSTGIVQESLFTYSLSGASYNSASVTLSNAAETADGAVTGLENFCAGGTFGSDGVSGCTGNAGGLVTADGAQNQDSATFAAAGMVSVTTDLTIDGGTAGTASGATLLEQFGTASTATPEPGSVALLAIGLLAVASRTKKPSSARVVGNREEKR